MIQRHKAELLTIPGIGKTIMRELNKIGIYKVEDLKGQTPEDMYDLLRVSSNSRLDRSMLYIFRCAVYYAENDEHEPELLKWWNWKDKK